MIMCVLLCYPVSIHMSQLQATGRPISSFLLQVVVIFRLGLLFSRIRYFKSGFPLIAKKIYC